MEPNQGPFDGQPSSNPLGLSGADQGQFPGQGQMPGGASQGFMGAAPMGALMPGGPGRNIISQGLYAGPNGPNGAQMGLMHQGQYMMANHHGDAVVHPHGGSLVDGQGQMM